MATYMGMTVTYNILFEVKILHHYFLNKGRENYEGMTDDAKADMMLKYDVREFLDITPTPECRKNLDRHHCIFKQTSTGIIVGMRAESNMQNPSKFKPFPDLDDDLAFTFLVNLNDPLFLNYTALPLTENSGNVYLFQNMKGSHAREFPSLCSLPDKHVNNYKYLPGDMVIDDLNTPATLFTAINKSKSDAAENYDPATHFDDWQSEKKSDGFPISYANLNDRHLLVRQTMAYRVKKAGIKPTIVVKSAFGTTVTPKITVIPEDLLLPEEFQTIQVDFGGLPEGFYSMHVESDDPDCQDAIDFYLLQQKVAPFGILRLAVKSDTTEYDMLHDGCILSPAYELRFRNRATHWRYVGKKFNALSVTKDAFPLTRFGFIENITVTNKGGMDETDLPNPEVSMIKAEALTVTAEKKFYSEIHIH